MPYDNCPTCGQMGQMDKTSMFAHRCKPIFFVQEVDAGNPEQVRAIDAQEAAEEFCEEAIHYSEGQTDWEVEVQPVDSDTAKRFKVTVEFEPKAYAEEL